MSDQPRPWEEPTVPETSDTPSLVSASKRMAVVPTTPGFVDSPGGELGDHVFGTLQPVSTVTPPGDGATTIASSGMPGMLDIVVDGVVAGTAWVSTGAETPTTTNVSHDVAAGLANVADVAAEITASLSATQEGNTLKAAGFVFPTPEVIRLLLGLPPQDEVERVFNAVAELRRLHTGDNEALAIVQTMIAKVAMARHALQSELEADKPRGSVIYVAAQALWDAVIWLGRQVRWLASKLATGFVQAAGAAIYAEHAEQIKQNAEQILTQAIDLEAKLTAIVTPIAHFFASMHLPF